jgi:2-desacetyl-2-hydroxyethyl bacteriochlorophyllide A dehydrogenase
VRYVEVSPGRATLTEGPASAPRPGAARVRVLACGVCGTDVHLLRGMRLPAGTSYPVRPGHEVAGTIVEFADRDSGGLTLGDLVVLHPLDPCGACGPCLGGQDQLCAQARVLGMGEPGGLAEEVVWPAARMVRATGLDQSAAAVLADAGATAYRAVRAARVRPGASVCVLGAGGVGTQVLKIIRALYPGVALAAVVGRAASADRLAGLDVRVEVGLAGVGRRLVAEMGEFDAVIEFTGSDAAPAQAMRMLRRGGRLVLGSVIEGPLTLGPAVRVQTRELRIVGVFSSGISDLRAVTEMCLSGQLDLRDAVTHRRPLSDAVEALEAVGAGVPGLVRMVVEMT